MNPQVSRMNLSASQVSMRLSRKPSYENQQSCVFHYLYWTTFILYFFRFPVRADFCSLIWGLKIKNICSFFLSWFSSWVERIAAEIQGEDTSVGRQTSLQWRELVRSQGTTRTTSKLCFYPRKYSETIRQANNIYTNPMRHASFLPPSFPLILWKVFCFVVDTTRIPHTISCSSRTEERSTETRTDFFKTY